MVQEEQSPGVAVSNRRPEEESGAGGLWILLTHAQPPLSSTFNSEPKAQNLSLLGKSAKKGNKNLFAGSI